MDKKNHSKNNGDRIRKNKTALVEIGLLNKKVWPTVNIRDWVIAGSWLENGL